jgi:hypothetical protein
MDADRGIEGILSRFDGLISFIKLILS